eukprot:CAMPEP_0115135572 /NCGR_PEP_ID=MMETSP0227-20121206/55813_1 /TAXON_ID=89957 /ORGANISM="Polarella glacialis, Strain CCMP 1383" /LENGTH=127 /DNA_ID=CAMNT_0002542351 /DNA_START=5 /DNA_END=389 /DNA_ORIENTATION=-
MAGEIAQDAGNGLVEELVSASAEVPMRHSQQAATISEERATSRTDLEMPSTLLPSAIRAHEALSQKPESPESDRSVSKSDVAEAGTHASVFPSVAAGTSDNTSKTGTITSSVAWQDWRKNSFLRTKQ